MLFILKIFLIKCVYFVWNVSYWEVLVNVVVTDHT